MCNTLVTPVFLSRPRRAGEAPSRKAIPMVSNNQSQPAARPVVAAPVPAPAQPVQPAPVVHTTVQQAQRAPAPAKPPVIRKTVCAVSRDEFDRNATPVVFTIDGAGVEGVRVKAEARQFETGSMGYNANMR